jgi:ComF family protein
MEKGLWGKIPVERAHSFLYYTKGGDVRKLLYELKYYRNPKIGHYLGRCMAEELVPTGFFDGIDYIIPVPLHKKKQETRGYNQSEQLAAGISSVLGCEVLDDVLIRVKQADTQTRKGHYERWINVKDVFDYVPSRDLSGKHILLLDDVFTTGATIVACADVLKQIPDLRISVLTLALAGEN